MANSTTTRVWTIDTAGAILTNNKIWVRKAVLHPNAGADSVLFNYYDVTAPITAGTKADKTGTITSTNTLTSTANLTNAVTDGSVFELLRTTGVATNLGRKLVETAGDNDVIVIHDDDWTNEASKVYSWITYTQRQALKIVSPGTEVVDQEIDFGPGGWEFPNLIIETLSANATVDLYIL